MTLPFPPLAAWHVGRDAPRTLFQSGHILSAANADGAAFDPDRSMVEFKKMPYVGLAIIRIVELSRPLSGSIWHQRTEDRYADQRLAALPGIGIILVSPGRARRRVD
jgi:hypothetical protein